MTLPPKIPNDLSDLLHTMAADFSAILRENLVGLYLWGSLTYDAFDETCSDVDLVAVTQRDLDAREFSELDAWFTSKKELNRWVARIDMRFVIDHEFLDNSSRCCGFYHHTPKLTRHAKDAFIETVTEVEVPGLKPESGSRAETLALKLAQSNRTIAVPFASEAGQFQLANVSAVVCGPGSIGQAHQPDEYIEIGQIEACIAFMRRLAKELS